jgi:hypothetical protein
MVSDRRFGSERFLNDFETNTYSLAAAMQRAQNTYQQAVNPSDDYRELEPRRSAPPRLMSNSTPLPAASVSKQKSDADPNEPPLFWQRLEHLAATHAAVFKLVVGHLDTRTARALRGVNRAMRLAVNSAVTTVVCKYDAPFDRRLDLGLVFTDASCLVVDLQPPHPSKLTAADTAIFLNHVSKWSPVLLAKIQSLRMTIHSMPVNIGTLAGSLAAFLSRWVPVDLRWICNSSGAALLAAPRLSQVGQDRPADAAAFQCTA